MDPAARLPQPALPHRPAPARRTSLGTGRAVAAAWRWALPVALAICLRALTLTPSLPYTAYMDEGHVLHPTMELIRSGGWDPGWYGYPPLTFYLVAFAAEGVDAFQHPVSKGGTMVEDLPSLDEIYSRSGRLYDIVGPTELLVTGRLVMLLLGIGTVVASGLLASTLFGPRTGWVTAWIVAACPSFVSRGSYVMVDTGTTFFATLTFYLVARFLGPGRGAASSLARPSYLLAGGAGLAAALALASKYSALTLAPAVLATLLVAEPTASRAIRSSLVFVAGHLAGLALGAPTLAFRYGEVVGALRAQSAYYAIYAPTPSYLREAVLQYEVGIPLLLAGAVGLWQMLLRRDQRAIAWGWLVFATLLTLPLLRYSFQPFRNLLPLCPLVAVAGAHFVAGSFGRPEGGKVEVAARWARIVVGVAMALSFGAGIFQFRASLVQRDSRVEAVDWLVQRVQPDDQVLVLRELAILPSEIRRLPAKTRVMTCRKLEKIARSTPSAYLVVGRSQAEAPVNGEVGASCGAALSAALEFAAFGSAPTPPQSDFWRTNLEAVRILRTPAPERAGQSLKPPAARTP